MGLEAYATRSRSRLSARLGRSFGALDVVLAVAIVAVVSSVMLERADVLFKRAYLTEAFGVATRAGIVSYHATKGEWPESSAGVDGPWILQIERADWPTVALTWGPDAPYEAGPQLAIDAATHADGATATITWVCGRARPPAPYARVGEAETTFAASVVPYTCRR